MSPECGNGMCTCTIHTVLKYIQYTVRHACSKLHISKNMNKHVLCLIFVVYIQRGQFKIDRIDFLDQQATVWLQMVTFQVPADDQG